MKIFGLEIKRDKEKRELEYISSYSDALNFSEIYNKFTAMNISAVYRCVEMISDSVAMLPIKVSIRNKSHREEIDHNLNFVLRTMSLTKFNFMKLLIQSVLLKGNSFAYIYRNADGSVKTLRYLEAGEVQIHYNKQKNELYYTCPLVSNRKIEPINMIHLIKDSYDGVNGISVLSYATRSINIANQTENQAKNFFSNGCNLSGILTVQSTLSDKQRQDIRTSWASAYGQGGSGLAVIAGNMQYQPISLNSKDAQLLESRLFNLQDIARFFGINPVLLGDLSHSSYSTIEAAQQEFILHTLQPFVEMIEHEFNRKLILPSESDLCINLDEKYLLKSDKTAEAGYYTSLLSTGVLCVNEVRKELGYSEIEGGDKHLIAYTDISQNTINSTEDEENNKE